MAYVISGTVHRNDVLQLSKTITIEDETTGESDTVTTNGSGVYSFDLDSLPSGYSDADVINVFYLTLKETTTVDTGGHPGGRTVNLSVVGDIYLDAIDGIITTLRDNITDPDSARSGAGKQFIYPDLPRVDATMPRVSVTSLAVGNIDHYLCDSSMTYNELIFQVDVWCDIHSSFTINEVKYSNTKLRDYLTGQIVQVLYQKRDTLEEYGIQDVQQVMPFGSLDAGEEYLTRGSSDYRIITLNQCG